MTTRPATRIVCTPHPTPPQPVAASGVRSGRRWQAAGTSLALGLGLLWGTPAVSATDAAALQACLDRLRPQAERYGVSAAAFDRHTQGASLLESTVQSARSQPEQRITWWDYLARVVDTERVQDGRAIFQNESVALATLANRFGVDPAVVVAIFGVETNYGKQLGKTPVLNAWLTRACVERRPLWVSNVYASVRLLEEGVVEPDEFLGSWSGAFGMTQFIPTSFYELAVDGDGDGDVDLYESLPDALASAANHLRQRGARWQRGLPAVIEVTLPERELNRLSQDPGREIFEQSRQLPLTQWQVRGARAAPGMPALTDLPSGTRAALFAPTGARGPVFLVTANFDALLQYNRSTRYALAVGVLANQIAGGPGIQAAWPTQDPGLSRAEVRELQSLLTAAGYNIGPADGIPGARTRDALAQAMGVNSLTRVGRDGLAFMRRQAASSVPGKGP